MVRDIRIKEYIFDQASANSVGSQVNQYSSHPLNGEILRVDNFSNYTGSIILRQSGLNVAWLNATTASGTNKWESFPFINTTGSFVTNGIVQLTISGVASGTANVLGPVSILYR